MGFGLLAISPFCDMKGETLEERKDLCISFIFFSKFIVHRQRGIVCFFIQLQAHMSDESRPSPALLLAI
jgi:hypothetical protein